MLEMDIVMMKITMMVVYLMVVTVVELVSTQNTVQNVYVMKKGNQCSTFHVSDLLKMP